MSTNFDAEIDRSGRYSTKWQFYMGPTTAYHVSKLPTGTSEGQAIPMWVADMDFRCAEPIVSAIESAAAHGIFGYSRDTGSYAEAVCGWFQERHQWIIEPESIVKTPGIITALNVAVQAFVKPGEKVLLNSPVYYPFYNAIRLQGAAVVSSSLKLVNGRYEFDFDDLARKLADPDVKMAFLCNPQNPGGMVWSVDDLRRYAELCLRHDVLLLSDEVHGDLTFSGNQFTPLLTLGEQFKEIAIICTSPSKAFNIAGLQCSNIVIPNSSLKSRFFRQLQRTGITGLSPFALTATEAAYRSSGPWLDECVAYLQANLEFAMTYFLEHIPAIVPMRPEATYLLWLDCTALNLNSNQLHRLFNQTAKVYLDDGIVFGVEGGAFVRMNFACTRNTLEIALTRIKQAVEELA